MKRVGREDLGGGVGETNNNDKNILYKFFKKLTLKQYF